MKKLFSVTIVVLAVFAVSCASTNAGSADTTGSFANQQEVDSAFEAVYEAYADALIMDGASNYTVVKGDTLSKIAGTKYGRDNTFYFPLIMLASHETTINDPDLIEPGMKLTIPDLKRNLDNVVSRAKIKSYLGDIAGIYDRKEKETAAKRLRELAAGL